MIAAAGNSNCDDRQRHASLGLLFLRGLIANNKLECENKETVSAPAKELTASPIVSIVICHVGVCNE